MVGDKLMMSMTMADSLRSAGRLLLAGSGSSIELRNTTINGVTYTFVASIQSDGNWIVEEVG